MARHKNVNGAEIRVGNRNYPLLSSRDFIRRGKSSVTVGEVVKRASKLRADAGRSDCAYFVDHQFDISTRFAETLLLFAGYTNSRDNNLVAYLCCGLGACYQGWLHVDKICDNSIYVVAKS